jgi:hypothetical protein
MNQNHPGRVKSVDLASPLQLLVAGRGAARNYLKFQKKVL